MDWPALYASRAARILPSDVRELARVMRQPDIISFGGGVPDASLFPIEAAAAASDRILTDPERARIALQYSESAGYMKLRAWVAEYMSGRGAPCEPENILITAGSQQALDLVGRQFLSAGERLLVEYPTYIGALRTFDACEASYGPIEEIGTSPAKLAYVMPDFRNPTGTCLSLDARTALLDRAARSGVPLVEDGAYERLRYDGAADPSLLALEIARTGSVERSGVLHISTFSKMIVPSLRIGWVVGPKKVISRLTLLKQAVDLHTSTFNQMLMLELADSILGSQVELSCALYRRRRDAVLQALARHMPADVSWTQPEGGMYLWVTLPDFVDGSELARRALAEDGVAVVAGKSFYPGSPRSSAIRLAFPQTPENRIDEGIGRLAALIRRMVGN